MVRIEGFISRKVIRSWLDNYDSLAAQDVAVDALPSNSGAKSYDGVGGSQMNKVMLDDAIEHLPPLIRACTIARWIKRWDTREATKTLRVSRDLYFIRCSQAVDLIYLQLNGSAVNYRNLVKEIKKGLTIPPTEP